MAVFAVKYRLGLIGQDWKSKLYAVIGQTLKSMDGVMPIRIGGVADHVHVLFSTAGNVAEAEIVRKVKSESSLWINSNRLTEGRFAWQRGGARISYSYSALPNVIAYIDNQETHHRRVSFVEEYKEFMLRLGFAAGKYDIPEEPIDGPDLTTRSCGSG